MSIKPYPSTFLLASGLFLLATTAQAQVTFAIGPTVGLTLAKARASNDDFPNTYRPGLEAGLLAAIGCGHFAVQPALLFSQKGYKSTYTVTYLAPNRSQPNTTADFTRNAHFSYLTLPLNMVYCQHTTGQGFQVFAGPYLSVLLGGRYESSGPNKTPAFYSDILVANTLPTSGGTTYYARRLDTGIQGGLGYRQKQLLVQVSYSLGLRNFQPTYEDGTGAACYNQTFQLSFSYLFTAKS
jgi:hypothetical protein